MEWENGLDGVRSFSPEFRANLGPIELVEEVYAKYHQKTLRVDPDTTRRMDLISLAGGYRDVTNAYHDSVEECLGMDGELDLDGEGHFRAGDYFWRAPEVYPPRGCVFYDRCPLRLDERCSTIRPPLQEVGPDHVVASFCALQNGTINHIPRRAGVGTAASETTQKEGRNADK